MKFSVKLMIVLVSLSFLQCDKDCIKTEKCNLEPEGGMCMAAFRKYYYDKKEKKCKEFIWGGCGGVVPFDTLDECKGGCQCD